MLDEAETFGSKRYEMIWYTKKIWDKERHSVSTVHSLIDFCCSALSGIRLSSLDERGQTYESWCLNGVLPTSISCWEFETINNAMHLKTNISCLCDPLPISTWEGGQFKPYFAPVSYWPNDQISTPSTIKFRICLYLWSRNRQMPQLR